MSRAASALPSSYGRWRNMVSALGLDLNAVNRRFGPFSHEDIAAVHEKWGPESLRMSRHDLLAAMCIDFDIYWNDNVLRRIWIELQIKGYPPRDVNCNN